MLAPHEKTREARTRKHPAALWPRRLARPPGASRRRSVGQDGPEPDLAMLVAQALQKNPSLHRYARYLAVLVEGLPAYMPVIGALADGSPAFGPLLPAMPGLGSASPSTVTVTELQDLQRALGRFAATVKLQQAAEHDREL